MADRKTTAIGVSALVAIVILVVVTLYGLYLLLKWVAGFVDDFNPTILAAIIVGCLTIVGSAFVASYNARRAQERVAQEANIARKAEVYEEFMVFLVDIMKSGKDSQDLASRNYDDFFFKFASKVTIYGGPNVVRAFAKWRESGDDNQGGGPSQLSYVDKFIREMRTDLGESNKGLAENEFLGLFVVGGKSKITEELEKHANDQ